MSENINKNDDKFFWIRDIIRSNIVSKLSGKSYANVIDMGTNTGTLITQLKKVITNSRFFAFPINLNNTPKLEEDVKLLSSHEEVKTHRYDLILSVFDIHILNWLEIAEFLKFIHEVADDHTDILFSDIETNTLLSKFLTKLASLFNPNLKSVISKTEAIELLESKGFTVLDKDSYKINDTWSAWIIICRKNHQLEA